MLSRSWQVATINISQTITCTIITVDLQICMQKGAKKKVEMEGSISHLLSINFIYSHPPFILGKAQRTVSRSCCFHSLLISCFSMEPDEEIKLNLISSYLFFQFSIYLFQQTINNSIKVLFK
jgi:hypothetical protein